MFHTTNKNVIYQSSQSGGSIINLQKGFLEEIFVLNGILNCLIYSDIILGLYLQNAIVCKDEVKHFANM